MKLKLIIVTLLLTVLLPSTYARAEEYVAGFKFDAQDYDSKEFLYMIVEAEAGGQVSSVRKHVTSVIVNRVNDKDFPDTYFKVVFQKGQFAPVRSGSIWDVKVTDRTREAVDYVLANGPTNRALYFTTGKFRGLTHLFKDKAGQNYYR